MAAGILITGSTGQVGGALVRALGASGEVYAPTRAELDLGDADSIRATVRSLRPRWIVNPGAYTAVDRAESEPELAYAINAEAPHVLGEEAQAVGAAVLHFSTDYVFSGEGTWPHREEDATGPLGVYGTTKLAGERALEAVTPAHLILRTSWVYGATGRNFLGTVLRVARERPAMRVVADQYGAPTWSADLASLTGHLIACCERVARDEGIPLDAVVGRVSGVYHAASAGETTWHGFAAEAVREMRKREPGTAFAAIEAITTAEYPTAARRPANSRLDCGKLAATFGWRMPEWTASLAQVLDEIGRGASE